MADSARGATAGSVEQSAPPLHYVSHLETRAWIMLALLAVVAGIYYRFLGFARWPLATDEYYIYRSMTFVLAGGLPEFPCGGYYTRGLLYQYLTAQLLVVGLKPEFALRLVAILSNLAMLPAAWLLARKLGGVRVAAVAVAVIILSLSVWQIEMARFGRMYAPFQAVFVWYLYHLYQLMTTGDRRRWRYLIALSVAGPLVWEGGVILTMLNFIPLLAGRRYSTAVYGLASVAILVVSVAFLSTNFRTLGPATALPPESSAAAAQVRSLVDTFPILVTDLLASPWAIAVLLGLLVFVVLALIRADVRRLELTACAALAAITGALLLNQLLLAGMIFAGAVLIRWLPFEAVKQKSLRFVWFALVLLAAWWIIYVVMLGAQDLTMTRRLRLIIGFPDLYSNFIYPWLRTDLVLTGLLALGVALASLFAVVREDSSAHGVSALLLVALLSLLLIGGSASLYQETWYSFFLYPALLILALYGIANLPSHFPPNSAVLTPFLLLLFFAIFAACKDLSVDHLNHIDRYEVNFRIEMPEALARHYYTRYDYAGTAEYVNRHANENDVIITTSTPLTNYLAYSGHIYLDNTDGRYVGQACDFGRMERWSGWPLLSSIDEVNLKVSHSDTWVVADALSLRREEWAEYLKNSGQLRKVIVSDDGTFEKFAPQSRGQPDASIP
jgi:hypothetical protein